MKLSLALLPCLILAACCSNPPAPAPPNQIPAATAPAQDTLAGNWTGTWQSTTGHGNGPLLATIIPIPPPANPAPDTQYFQATFKATYAKSITSEYTVIFAAKSAAAEFQVQKAVFEIIKNQVAGGTLELPPDEKHYDVENDSTLWWLAQKKRMLVQQLKTAEDRGYGVEFGPNPQQIEASIEEIEEKEEARRKDMELMTGLNMLRTMELNLDIKSQPLAGLIKDQPTTGLIFTGEKDLGLLSGGLYHYTGTVHGDDFQATYQSKADNGAFTLKRVH